MNRQQFEAAYAARSGISIEHCYALGVFPAVPCNCGDESCDGWRRRYADEEDQ